MLNLHRIKLSIKGVTELSVQLWDIVPWVKSCKHDTNTKRHNYNEVSVSAYIYVCQSERICVSENA